MDQVTLLFNAGTGKVKPLRSKEESHDYRYFPDPDLPPLVLSSTWIEEQRAALPELPEARRGRLERAFALSTYDARVLTSEAALADYFESVVSAGAEPKSAANWVMGDVMATFNETGELPGVGCASRRTHRAGSRRRRESSGREARLRRARARRTRNRERLPSGSVWCR